MMSGTIRVAIVCTSLNQMGGKTVHFKNMYLSLKDKGIRMAIVLSSSMEKDYRRFMEEAGVAQEDLYFIPRFKKWLIVPFILELKNFFIKRNIDIVHTFQIQSDFFGNLAARLAGIRRVISQQESTMIEESLPFYKKLFYRSVNALLWDSFAKTVVVSDGLKKELVSLGYRPEDKIETIRLGVNLPEEYRGRHFSFTGLRSGSPVIGTVTRLNREKGVDRFIEAIPHILGRIPRARFIIVGIGDEEKGLKKRASELNLGQFLEFKSWINPVYTILENIDIFVMSSLREGCPMALLEAMAFSRPVVASRAEGIRELIEDGRDGLMTDTSDPELFAEKVASLCRNYQEAIIMGQEASKKILANYTMDAEMERYLRLYHATNSRLYGNKE